MIEWHDCVRALSFCLGLYTLWMLLYICKHQRDRWGEKMKDIWYVLLMWNLAGLLFNAQGIYHNRPYTTSFVFVTAAVLVSAKVLHHRGSKGRHSDANIF